MTRSPMKTALLVLMHLFLTGITSGLWLIVLIIWYIVKNK